MHLEFYIYKDVFFLDVRVVIRNQICINTSTDVSSVWWNDSISITFGYVVYSLSEHALPYLSYTQKLWNLFKFLQFVWISYLINRMHNVSLLLLVHRHS